MTYETLQQALACVRQITDFVPAVGLILGSGLGALADELDAVAVVDYSRITGFPVSTVPGHRGRFVFGYLGRTPVVIMQGRVHYYEGYSMQEVVMPVRLMRMMGARALFLTNAAGGANRSFRAGDLMLITDQLMCLVPNPLIGPNLDELGPRFPDMSEIYDAQLRSIIVKTAQNQGIDLKQGVYCQFTGPTFESPAEVRAAITLGADAVGMSTACEAAAARHCGLRVYGISCITNQAAGLSATPLSHEEVTEVGNAVAPVFRALVRESIAAMGEVL